MTKFHDIELSDEIVEVFQQFILDASDEDILNYAQYGNKALLKGFQPKKENVGRIKERFVKRLGAGKKITKDDAGFLMRHNPYSFFDGLEEKTIITNLDALCSSLGKAKMEAVLLLSDRSEITALAGRMISGEHEIKEISDQEAKKFASRTFHAYLPFICELRETFDPGYAEESDAEEESAEEPDSAKGAGTSPKLKAECARLREQLTQIKKDLRGYKKDALRAGDLDIKLQRTEKKLSERKTEVAGLKEKLAEVSKELELLQSAISTQVDEELASSLHSWLQTPKELQNEVDRASGGDLVEKAAGLVEKQQEMDRHSGNRNVLSRRMHEANEVRAQLAVLSRESLNPLPALGEMISDLDREIAHLRDQLNKGGDVSAFAQNFMAKIGQAESPNAVVGYKRILESIKAAGVLEREDARVLFEYCDKRMDLAYDKYVPDIKDPTPVRDPFRSLKESIYKNQELIWFLDGHNILFGLEDLFGTFGADGKPAEAARHRLSEALIALVANANQCQVRLYFDGPDHSEYSPASNMKVIYSGGTGEHRADDAICADMEYLCGKASS
ncbi:MAG: hypothetical protein H8E68_01650, partial [Kiritimatiellaeota bacterium]|nr:hypothetical protein [Kiritimatiellota bacterium]